MELEMNPTFGDHVTDFKSIIGHDLWHVLEKAIDLKEKRKTICFTSVVEDTGNKLVICILDESGYIDTKLIFKEPNYLKTIEICEIINEKFFNINKQDSMVIVSSSMMF